MPTKKTEEAAASKPTRSRKVVAPEPVVEPAKPDRTMFWALAVVAVAVVFAAGYLVGHAVADDGGTALGGRGHIVISGDFPNGMPMFPGGHAGHRMPGMPPYGVYPAPDRGDDQGQTDDQGQVAAGQGYLGISGVDTPGAVLIVEVLPGSPADQAGITSGDRLISFDGTSIGSMEQLAGLVRGTAPGTEVEVVLGGPGGGHTVTVVVGERPGEQ